MTTREHGTRARYVHGPGPDTGPGCRCDHCTAANQALRQAGMTKQGRQTLDEQTAARLAAAGSRPTTRAWRGSRSGTARSATGSARWTREAAG
jgi:hypothetical protein